MIQVLKFQHFLTDETLKINRFIYSIMKDKLYWGRFFENSSTLEFVDGEKKKDKKLYKKSVNKKMEEEKENKKNISWVYLKNLLWTN